MPAAAPRGKHRPDPASIESELPQGNGRFKTLRPALKNMFDRAGNPGILSCPWRPAAKAAKGKVAPLSFDPVGFDVVLREGKVIGAAIAWKDNVIFTVE